MVRKYKFTGRTKVIDCHGERTIHRIQACIDIPRYDVKTGDLGGWIESENNLSHDGDAWVKNNAVVMHQAVVSGDALVCHDAVIMNNARVDGFALVRNKTCVFENAHVTGKVELAGNVWAFSDVVVAGDRTISGDAMLCGAGSGK